MGGHAPRRLNGVRVKNYALFAADGAYFFYRQYRTDFVVCKHHRHKAGVVANGVFYLLWRNVAVFVNIKKLNVKALFFKLFKRVKHRVMLKRC